MRTCVHFQKVSDFVQIKSTFRYLPLHEFQLSFHHQQLSTSKTIKIKCIMFMEYYMNASGAWPVIELTVQQGAAKRQQFCHFPAHRYTILVFKACTYWLSACNLMASFRASRHCSRASLIAPQLTRNIITFMEQVNSSDSSRHLNKILFPVID